MGILHHQNYEYESDVIATEIDSMSHNTHIHTHIHTRARTHACTHLRARIQAATGISSESITPCLPAPTPSSYMPALGLDLPRTRRVMLLHCELEQHRKLPESSYVAAKITSRLSLATYLGVSCNGPPFFVQETWFKLAGDT